MGRVHILYLHTCTLYRWTHHHAVLCDAIVRFDQSANNLARAPWTVQHSLYCDFFLFSFCCCFFIWFREYLDVVLRAHHEHTTSDYVIEIFIVRCKVHGVELLESKCRYNIWICDVFIEIEKTEETEWFLSCFNLIRFYASITFHRCNHVTDWNEYKYFAWGKFIN